MSPEVMLDSTLSPPPHKSHCEGAHFMLFLIPPGHTPAIRAMATHLAAQNSTQQALMGHNLHPSQVRLESGQRWRQG